MPPKGKSGGGGGGGGGGKNQKKANKKQDTGEFDEFLKQLSVATKETGGKKGPIVTQEQRRQQHKDRHEDQERKRQSDIGAAMLQQQQQQQQQQYIRDMIEKMMKSPFGSKPVTEFGSEQASSDKYEASTGWMQGWRPEMEDAHITLPSFKKEHGAGLFAVFDGHAGAKCAALCQAVFPIVATQVYDNEAKSMDMTRMYTDLDVSLRTKLQEGSGCTAVCVLVNDATVTCANVGDSRAVLCRADGKAVDLSEDHKPENPEERKRIEAAGGQVTSNRVNGELAMSRAMGDFRYKTDTELPVDKQLVTPIPDVVTVPREAGDKFLVLACDGIFDVLTNQETVDFVRAHLEGGESLESTCKAACNRCLAPEDDNGRPARAVGTDNMTITIVTFK